MSFTGCATDEFDGKLKKINIKSTNATAASGAVTLNEISGVITSESLTTAAGSDYTLTLTNNKIYANSMVFCSVKSGSNTTVGIVVHEVTEAAGSVVIKIRNQHASAALNGTIQIKFFVSYPV